MENISQINLSFYAVNELKETVDKYLAVDIKTMKFKDKKQALAELLKVTHSVLEERDNAISEFLEKQPNQKVSVAFEAIIPIYLAKSIQIQKEILDSYMA